MKLYTVKDIKNLIGKRVLVRVDFNVPVKSGKVVDNFKIQKSLPTIKYLLNNGAKVVLVSHLGRPEGKEKKFSLLPVANELEKLLRSKVFFGKLENPEKWSNEKLVLLENIRFYPGEESCSHELVGELLEIADIFVLDGFAVAHRDAASVSGVAKYLPSFAGLLLVDEIFGLSKVLVSPKIPLAVLIGGIKMETKIPVLKNLLPKADKILVGGGIMNTYLWAMGHKVGMSYVDKKFKKEVLFYLKNKKIIKPIDVIVGKENGKNARVESLQKKLNLKKDEGIFDIGPRTVLLFSSYLKKSNSLVWNGAMGRIEQHPYEYGTNALARIFAARSKGKAFGVCGGGETVEVLRKLDIIESVDLVSTGGGAMLEFLGGKKLPGLKNLFK